MFHRSLRSSSFKNDLLRALTRIPEFQRFSTNREKNVSSFVAIKLENKRLLRVSGYDSFIYLQSLLTNDMRHLLPLDRLQEEAKTDKNIFQDIYSLNQPVIYSYICSAVGKVLCDMFVYRLRYRAEDGEYILEVDANIANAIKRLLLGYNLSRNVKVELANDLDLWTLIPDKNFHENADKFPYKDKQPELLEIDSDDIKLVSDPRIPQDNFLGYRFLTRLGGKKIEDVGRFCKVPDPSTTRLSLRQGNVLDYVRYRYRFGVSEGYSDNLSGFYFPFELNGDILNAVSLNKGLYTSEEKLIKIYSTKGIKQRIFPVIFEGSEAKINYYNPAPRTLLKTTRSKSFGEMRQRVGRYGIANLWVPMERNNRILDYSLNKMPTLVHENTRLKVRPNVPFWWPWNIDQQQLRIPDYPKCMFNTQISDSWNILEESHHARIAA